ncbi:MAG: hypothetical protein R3194_04765 [Limnobacter sp.]|nr:hypothetical protein [Limnobacter sp.]
MLTTMFKRSRWASSAFACLLSALPVAALANPFLGYTGKAWSEDLDVLKGECAVAKALIIEQSSLIMNDHGQALFAEPEPDHRVDVRCFAHTLELVPTGQAVKWSNPRTQSHLFLTPGRYSDDCRSFRLIKVTNGQQARFNGVACSKEPGQWEIVSRE